MAPIDYFPFPHVIIENFFPDDLYRDIVALNPFQLIAGSPWETRATRKEFRPSQEAADLGSEPHASFWHAVARTFLEDRWFFELITQKFPEYFKLRYGSLVKEPDWLSFFDEQLFTQRLDSGFFLSPHTDMPMRVATCVFSFAEDTSCAEYGTELCVPFDRLLHCDGRHHHPREAFRVVKLAPYKPNNFLLFVRTPFSFHAVRPIDRNIPSSRYGMQYQLWERGGGIFHDTQSQ